MNHASSLMSQFFSTAQARAQATFLDGDIPLTYGAAANEIAQRARWLIEAAEGCPVVLTGPNTANWVIDFLAARTAGLVVIPMSAEATEVQWHEFGELIGSYYMLDTGDGSGQLMRMTPTRHPMPKRTGFGLPTSGTTGAPRCVLRSDMSLLAEGWRYVSGLGFAPSDRILVALPLGHAFILGVALGGAIAAGCAVYLIPRFVPRRVQSLIRQGNCTILPLVPATARLMCEAFRDEGSPPKSLRHIIIGAGPVSPALEREVVNLLCCLPARNYGSSETGATLGTTGQAVPDHITGVPLPGVEADVVGEGDTGALFVRLPETFIGYLSADGIDTSRVSPDGWYSTGDQAIRHQEGGFTVTGRLGQGLRRGGRFIQPAEVERVLQGHPDVVDVIVVGEPDVAGEDRVIAHVETGTDVSLDINVLQHYLSQTIEAYKFPTEWRFYRVLPRTSGGKPDRMRLMSPTEE